MPPAACLPQFISIGCLADYCQMPNNSWDNPQDSLRFLNECDWEDGLFLSFFCSVSHILVLDLHHALNWRFFKHM